ncbi:carbohydrate ABC transporter permease [Phytohabitans sp. ZYX-F-186]|uniref:Carbohydrate ABC transporter permease n=1 Tax=Phytohabitans maris TaxID=3071409 RepID=A0ABU0ZM78_9ACTN|nr:carbohydrate ABC transporter permease [Phytohabitans sp. ZYX-F-186]MDQ7908134.1 carbohydrate ABC transporter permease [Phytohabitans sp. ZYX-F-186]
MTQLLTRPDTTVRPATVTAKRVRPHRIPTHLTLLLVCGVWTVPVLGLLVSSFRPAYDISTTGWWRAGEGTLTTGNYRDVLATGGFGTALANSLLITVPAVAAMVAVGSVAAFALARMSFAGRRAVTVAMVALLALPLQMTLVPVLRLYNAAGLTGTFAGIWLVHLGFGLPFAVYLLRTFFAALPDELFEAAALDGASTLTAFLRVAVPVSGPAIASVAIFQFIWVWNDLLIALIFLGGDPGVAPLTVAVSNLVSATTGQGWQLLTAAAFVAMAVPMVIFFALQRYFVRGLLAGSGK